MWLSVIAWSACAEVQPTILCKSSLLIGLLTIERNQSREFDILHILYSDIPTDPCLYNWNPPMNRKHYLPLQLRNRWHTWKEFPMGSACPVPARQILHNPLQWKRDYILSTGHVDYSQVISHRNWSNNISMFSSFGIGSDGPARWVKNCPLPPAGAFYVR